MKSVTKLLLAGAVVLAAVVISAPSQAAKKKPAGPQCNAMGECSVCKGKSCEVMRCEGGKTYKAFGWSPVCLPPNCPQKC